MSIDLIKDIIENSIHVKEKILEDEKIISKINDIAEIIINNLINGGKLILCGNGGSASDALHFAGEMVGRFQKERKSLPAIVLNADIATMTAIANDYNYNDIFSRQIDAYMNSSDVFIGITTSGDSKNIINAAIKAKEIGGICIALSGKNGGKIKNIVDHSIIVPSDITARIQESHILIIHILCQIIEEKMF